MTTSKPEILLVTVDTFNWDHAAENIAKEKRMANLFLQWAASELPPIPISLSTDDGFRIFINTVEGTDLEKHQLLAWLVRHSGKKFFRFAREESITWWNRGTTRPENEEFKDHEGPLHMLILLENGALGRCHIIKNQVMVEKSEIVCD